jgi:hypothetical protein
VRAFFHAKASLRSEQPPIVGHPLYGVAHPLWFRCKTSTQFRPSRMTPCTRPKVSQAPSAGSGWIGDPKCLFKTLSTLHRHVRHPSPCQERHGHAHTYAYCTWFDFDANRAQVQTTASPLPTQVRNNVGTAVKACGFDSCSCCNSICCLSLSLKGHPGQRPPPIRGGSPTIGGGPPTIRRGFTH